MKMREVVLRAIAKKITWDQAADILGMSHSAMWRLRGLYQRRGYDGFWVRATRKPGGLPIPLSDLEKVLLLYQQKYSHLDARSFQKILIKKHSIHLDSDCLSQALREAGSDGPHASPFRARVRDAMPIRCSFAAELMVRLALVFQSGLGCAAGDLRRKV